jgi:glycine oxidase
MNNKAQGNGKADIVVIGGGIIGCSVAMRLAQAKAKVTVLERGEIGTEASSAAAGMLAPQGEMISPPAFSDLCLKSRDLYPDFVAEIKDLSGEKVGYRTDGAVLVGISDAECHELEETYHVQTKRGLPLELLTGDEARRRVPGLAAEIRTALFVPGDHWLDNVRLMSALAKACTRLGVTLRPHSDVKKLNATGGKVENVTVGGNGGGETASASQFILAAGCWSRDLAASPAMEKSLQPCRGQILEFESPDELPHVVRAGHFYLVPRAGRRVVAGTTAEYTGYDKAVTAEGMRSVIEGVSRIAPFIKNYRFTRAWAGLRPDTKDHLPVVGHGELKNLIFSTGHFRNGILLAPANAQVVSELTLTGKSTTPLELYSPLRLSR